MKTFHDFLVEAEKKGEVVNLAFEQNLFRLVSILDRIVGVVTDAGVAYELVGGLAVLIHLEAVDPANSIMTRDVDVMINRQDLERLKQAAAGAGFQYRHSAGLDMLLYGDEKKALNAVHLVFSGEKVRPPQAAPNPSIAPEQRTIHGRTVMVIRVDDLLRMKLSAFRDKDRVHVRSLDACGLITPEMEAGLPPELIERLKHVRETE